MPPPRRLLLALVAVAACDHLDAGPVAHLPDVTADAADASAAPSPDPSMACHSYNGYEPDRDRNRRLEVRLLYLRPGKATEASLCIQGETGEPADNCRPFHGPAAAFPKVWTIDLNADQRLQVWAFGTVGGHPTNDCFLYREPRSFLKFRDAAGFEAVFWARDRGAVMP